MPRVLPGTGASYVAEMQGDRTATNHRLVLELGPGGSTVNLTDYPWTASDRPIVRSWGEIAPQDVVDEGVPPTRTFEVELSNRVWDGSRIADDLDISNIEGSEATLYAFTRGVGDDEGSSVTAAVFHGQVMQVSLPSPWTVRVSFGDRAAFLDKKLDHLVGDDYANAPPSSIQRLQPLVYGEIQGWPLVPVQVGLVGVLAEDIDEAGPTIVLQEDIKSWPSSGVLQLGPNELASFSGKDNADKELTGLARGDLGTLATEHKAGAVVILRVTAYKFLVADRDVDQVLSVDNVWLRGAKVHAAQWSYDPLTNLVTINPPSTVPGAGRETLSKHQAVERGLWPPNAHPSGSGHRATLAMFRQTVDAGRPLINAAHASMAPWKEDALGGPVWKWWSDPLPLDTEADADQEPVTSTAKLYPGTAVTWLYTQFETDLPPASIMTRTGYSVSLELAPRRENYALGRRARNMQIKGVKVVLSGGSAGMSAVERVQYLGVDDHLTNPLAVNNDLSSDLLLGTRISQHMTFDFTGDVDPDDAPFDVEVTVLSDAGPTDDIACFVQSLVQSVHGVIKQAGSTGVFKGVEGVSGPSDPPGNPSGWSAATTFTFPSVPSVAVLGLAVGVKADYIRVTCGSGTWRIVPPAVQNGVQVDDDFEGTAIFNILIESPGTVVTVYAERMGATEGSTEDLEVKCLHVTSCVMSGIPTGSDSYPMLPAQLAESAWLLEYGEYPTCDLKGFSVGGGSGYDNPSNDLKHFLQNVMGQVDTDLDLDAFNAAKDVYNTKSWKFAGGVLGGGDARAVLQRMAREAGAVVLRDPFTGLWTINVRETTAEATAGAIDHTWDPADFVGGPPAIERTAQAELVTKVRAKYLRKWAQESGEDQYAASVTSGAGTETADERYEFDFVREEAMAQALADLYAGWDDTAKRMVFGRLWPRELAVLRGDRVSLTWPMPGGGYWQGLNGTRFVVLDIGYQPGNGPQGVHDNVPIILVEVP